MFNKKSFVAVLLLISFFISPLSSNAQIAGESLSSLANLVNQIAAELANLQNRLLAQVSGGSVSATVETGSVGDPDDMAIWVHPTDPGQSLVLATNKNGGLLVYDLAGVRLQSISLGEVNNVDLRYGFMLGGQPVDIMTATDRDDDTILIYKINPSTRRIENIAARSIGSGSSEIYGLAMYKSPTTGKIYTFVSHKSGIVQQWELFESNGKIDAKKVREFDNGGQTEGVVADDELAYFYAAEETGKVKRYNAEPTGGSTNTSVASVGSGLSGEIEGLTIYYAADKKGYLLINDQGPADTLVVDRNPPHAKLLKFDVSGVGDPDGIDVESFALGSAFPKGVYMTQDGNELNFKYVPWDRIASKASLLVDTTQNPRNRNSSGTPPPPPPPPGDTTTAPAAPTSLTASAASATQINLSWTDNSNNESGFKIERSTDGATFAQIATASAGAATYSATGLTASTQYYFRVRATNTAGDSAYTTNASATTLASGGGDTGGSCLILTSYMQLGSTDAETNGEVTKLQKYLETL
ncbi:MAG: phytase, partial [bacterium]|nr:phytase [bacterium]